jgi:hypothetical protein
MVSDGEITRMTPEEIESCRLLREQVAAFCEEMRVREHISQPPLHYDMGWNLFFLGAGTATLIISIALGARFAGYI